MQAPLACIWSLFVLIGACRASWGTRWMHFENPGCHVWSLMQFARTHGVQCAGPEAKPAPGQVVPQALRKYNICYLQSLTFAVPKLTPLLGVGSFLGKYREHNQPPEVNGPGGHLRGWLATSGGGFVSREIPRTQSTLRSGVTSLLGVGSFPSVKSEITINPQK